MEGLILQFPQYIGFSKNSQASKSIEKIGKSRGIWFIYNESKSAEGVYPKTGCSSPFDTSGRTQEVSCEDFVARSW